MPVTLKQGDTFPEIEFLLEAENDAGVVGPVDLSTADEILIVALSGATLVTGICVADADQVANKGQGTYTLITADTATEGVYDVEFKVTWNVGQIERFPNTGYESLTIEQNLGG